MKQRLNVVSPTGLLGYIDLDVEARSINSQVQRVLGEVAGQGGVWGRSGFTVKNSIVETKVFHPITTPDFIEQLQGALRRHGVLYLKEVESENPGPVSR